MSIFRRSNAERTRIHSLSIAGLIAWIDSPVLAKAIIGSALLIAAIIALSVVALSVGPFNIPFSDTIRALLTSIGLAESASVTSTEQAVIEKIRLPRIALALTAGMALATAGAVMQAIFRNPMADPGIIGTSSGGALGAVFVIFLGLSSVPLLIPAASFIGSTAALFVVFAIAFVGGRFSIAALLLSGIAISSFLGAAVSALLISTDNFTAQREMIFWLAGGIDAARWEEIRIILPVALIGVAIAFTRSRDLNLLLVGDDEARSLGIRVAAFRIAMALTAATLTAVAVAFTGIIAFVGLIVPHAIRLVVGADHRHVLILSALGGALFLLLADTIARTITAPAEIRVGIVTALIGAPVFVALLISNKNKAGAV